MVADRYRTNHFVETVARATTSTSSTRWPAVRRALRRQLGHPHLPRLPAGAQARDGGAVGRRRRRELRRLPPLPHAPDGRAAALGAAAGMRQPVFGLLGPRLPQGRLGAARVPRQDHLRGMARTSVEAYFHSVSILRGRCAAAVQRRVQARARRLRRAEVFERHAPRAAGTDDPLALIQYLDLKTYLVGDINTKVDRASMAHSLEVREPLMDHPLVEWLATLPIVAQDARHEGKYLLKKAMEPMLPHDVLYRPKMGFAVPLARWFRGPLKQRVRDACWASGCSAPAGSTAATWSTWSRSTRAAPRLQRAAVDAADVRGLPAQRGRRRSARRAPARPGDGGGMTLDPARAGSLDPAAQRLHLPHAGHPARAARLGWETLQLTTPSRALPARRRARRRLHFHRTPSAGRTGLLRQMQLTAARIAQVVREEKPDLVHAHSPVLNVLPALWGRRSAAPARGLRDARLLGRRRRRPRHHHRGQRALPHVAGPRDFALRRADHVTTICEGLRGDIALARHHRRTRSP
jgi:hypothetical protein